MEGFFIYGFEYLSMTHGWMGSEGLTAQDLADMEAEKRSKEAFAIALMHNPTDPLNAARAIEPYDSYRAIWISQQWPQDPYVLAHTAKLLTDVSQLLPTKVQLSSLAMTIAHDKFATAEAKLKAMRFVSDLQGWTGSSAGIHASITASSTVSSTNRVMEVPVSTDIDTWEARAVKQQENLTTTYSVVPDDEQ